MANLADLTSQELAQFNRHMTLTKNLVRKIVRLRADIAEHLQNRADAGINPLKPDDHAARGGYLTNDVDSLTNSDFNKAHNVMEDIYAYLNAGNDFEGTAHNENYTDADREGHLFNIPRFNLA